MVRRGFAITGICWKKIWHVRELIVDRHDRGSIADVEIERLPAARQLSVKIHTAKPGVVIGRKGASVNQLTERPGRADPQKGSY
jgi:ribosomal protein S3